MTLDTVARLTEKKKINKLNSNLMGRFSVTKK